MAKLTIEPINKVIEVTEGQDILTALKENSINIKNSCGGCASCTHCVVVVKSGQNNLTPMTFEEKQVLGNTFHLTQERLSCQTLLVADATIDITHHGYEKPAKPKPVLRKKEQVQEIRQERMATKKEKPKRLGGGNKPRAFDFDPDAKFKPEDIGE